MLTDKIKVMIKIAATYMSDSGKVDYIMKLVPLGDRVVIKALVAEETTKSGIVLPGQAKELQCRLSLEIR